MMMTPGGAAALALVPDRLSLHSGHVPRRGSRRLAAFTFWQFASSNTTIRSLRLRGGAGFEVALLGNIKRASRGQTVVGPRGVVVTRNIEQVCAHGIDAVVPGKRGVGLRRGKLLQTLPRAMDH